MTTTVKVVQKSILRRTVLDLEPKLVAGLITALGSSQIISLVVTFLQGTKVLPLVELATLVPSLAFLAAGYLKVSTHKGALMAKVEADLPGDLATIAGEAADAGLLPDRAKRIAETVKAILTPIGTFPVNPDHGSNIQDVPPEVAAALETPAVPPTIEPTPMLPTQP